jgi:hypothetical protein
MPVSIFNNTGIFSEGAESITAFVLRAQANPAGNLYLLGPATLDVYQGTTQLINLDGGPDIVKTSWLLTCASVVYASDNAKYPPAAWVHHAPGGLVTAEDVHAALAGLGNPPLDSMLVIYAHPKPTDPGYQEAINTIIGAGIAANRVIEITNLKLSTYGINAHGQVGS